MLAFVYKGRTVTLSERRHMSVYSNLIARLHKRAYDQGYRAGAFKRPWNLADWEPEFHASYQRGYDDGLAERGGATET